MSTSDHVDRSPVVSKVEQALGYHFRNANLLTEALTHTSYAFEQAHAGVQPNERLEFLGDAVIGLVASTLLFSSFPDADEGRLTSLRAALVRASALAQFARELYLGDSLLLGRGEAASGGRDRDLLLARAYEAVVGALLWTAAWTW